MCMPTVMNWFSLKKSYYINFCHAHLGRQGRRNTVGFFSTAFTAGHLHSWYREVAAASPKCYSSKSVTPSSVTAPSVTASYISRSPYIHNSMLIFFQGLVGHESPHCYPSYLSSRDWRGMNLISIVPPQPDWCQVQNPTHAQYCCSPQEGARFTSLSYSCPDRGQACACAVSYSHSDGGWLSAPSLLRRAIPYLFWPEIRIKLECISEWRGEKLTSFILSLV